MTLTKEGILTALRNVIDPDLKKDLVSLNMIKDINIQDKNISFTLELTTPACPLKNYLRDCCISEIQKYAGSEVTVNINITSSVSERRKSEQELSGLQKVKNIIAVISGKGGVGKSTISANLAVGLAMEGAKVGLIDGDIYGPSLPIMFGLQKANPVVKEMNGRQMIEPLVAYGVKLISIGFFIEPETSLMWRGPMASGYLKQLITDTLWEDLDYLIFDMPPGTGDMHLTLVQTVPVSGAVVVSTPQEIALADARKAVTMFRENSINVPILGIVENMSYFSPKDLPENKYYIFGKEGAKNLAAQLQIPLLGEIPIDENICNSGDNGKPVVLESGNPISEALLKFCRNTAQAVSVRNASLPETKTVKIQ